MKQYLLITVNYWAFTLTDGALRMLVVLYFYQLGYSPLSIASLFLFYEFFGIVTNLLGGWFATKIGLNQTMNLGLLIQVFALCMLLVPADCLTVLWVMIAQALSGIAKDLNKMSAKSAIKLLVPMQEEQSKQSNLYLWVSRLTGSKNIMKGVGFFLGAALLNSIGFRYSAGLMASILLVILIISLFSLQKNLGKTASKTNFLQLLSKNKNINYLSAARFFLFGARDIWFVVALPVYLSSQLNWHHWQIGTFMASWIIGYGLIQTISPKITGKDPQRLSLIFWSAGLSILTLLLAFILFDYPNYIQQVLTVGLALFGIIFAINSSLHSYFIVAFSNKESISLDVGFYYMANAAGRLIGTLLSGWIYQIAGLEACLSASATFILMSTFLSLGLQKSATQNI